MNEPKPYEVRTYGNIQAQYRVGDWIAFMKGNPSEFEQGVTEDAALGALVRRLKGAL